MEKLPSTTDSQLLFATFETFHNFVLCRRLAAVNESVRQKRTLADITVYDGT